MPEVTFVGHGSSLESKPPLQRTANSTFVSTLVIQRVLSLKLKNGNWLENVEKKN